MDAFNLIYAIGLKIKISLLFVTVFAHSQMCLLLPFQSSPCCLLFPIPQEQDSYCKEACTLKPHSVVDYLGFLVPVVNYPKKLKSKRQSNKQTKMVFNFTLRAPKPLPLFIITTLHLRLGKTIYFV